MNPNRFFAGVFFLFFATAFAQDYSNLPTIDEVCDEQQRFGFFHNYGFAWASVTRIKKMSDVSNYVWDDRMAGIFYELQSHNLFDFNDSLSLNFMGRCAVYYPYRYRFRRIIQYPKQMLTYSFDFFTAPVITFNFHDWARLNIEPGLHFMYQLNDRWNYWNLGPAIKMDTELPLSSRITILMGGMFSWDNGNLGSNRNIRDFDEVWEWQFQFGMRYSKKHLNRRSYIKYKPKPARVRHRDKRAASDLPSSYDEEYEGL